MLIKRVILEDFGVYGGRYEFDLTPHSDGHFNRPIVLFSGKNGVGKTSFVEAIRLCLHGSMALGGRVSRSTYKEHLLKRIHQPNGPGTNGEAAHDHRAVAAIGPDKAGIVVEFDYISAGSKIGYRVERRWHRTPSGDVSEQLDILETTKEGTAPPDIGEENKDSFLRELIPPSVTDLFFFDGEKIEALTKDDVSSAMLATTVRTLLGLHFVEQLRKDLDVYITRSIAAEAPADLGKKLEETLQEYERLSEEKEHIIPEKQRKNLQERTITQEAIAHQEQEIASAGGSYAKRADELKQARQRLERDLDVQHRHVQDLCSGLMPFAVAPSMCRQVADRLGLESEYRRWKTSKGLVDKQLEGIEATLSDSSFWKELEIKVSKAARRRLTKKLKQTVRQAMPVSEIADDEVFLRLSALDRAKLTGWIDQALHMIPQEFTAVTQEYLRVRDELKKVRAELDKTPADLILQPLVETKKNLDKKLEALLRENKKLTEEYLSTAYKLEQAGFRVKNLKEEIRKQYHGEESVDLAAKTQEALVAYTAELTQQKISLLEEALVKRFNELCRKENLIDGASINPANFRMELRRGGQTFGRDQLSAGEKQLLAISTIWALRDVSGVPMPVIVDTPLGRLDSDHRLSMIQNYFPRASHQVVLLATDTEVDRTLMLELEPAVSHAYALEFDAKEGRTVVSDLDLSEEQELEEEVGA